MYKGLDRGRHPHKYASFLSIVLISRRQTPSAEEQRYLQKLHETPAEEVDARATRITLLAPALLILYGAVMPFLLLNYYVLPFQRGRGTVLPGDAINWSQAEPWIAFGPAALFIPLGLIAAITISRRYSPA
ncbi:MAG: hypothetical protein ACI87W_000333 [Halieaceae bacterium]